MRQEKATKQRKRTVNVFGYAILSEQTAFIAKSQKLENHKVTFKKCIILITNIKKINSMLSEGKFVEDILRVKKSKH